MERPDGSATLPASSPQQEGGCDVPWHMKCSLAGGKDLLPCHSGLFSFEMCNSAAGGSSTEYFISHYVSNIMSAPQLSSQFLQQVIAGFTHKFRVSAVRS